MPRLSREPVRLLPHRAASGLFRTEAGEYLADIKLPDGKRVRRNLGTDRNRALILFDALLADLADRGEASENPTVREFLTGAFLDSQRRLRSFVYTERCVAAIVRFLDARHSNLRIADVRKEHGEALIASDATAPQTRRNRLQKFKQAMNLAVDMGLLDANPLARVKGVKFDNRRMRVLNMSDFVRIVDAARGDARDIVTVLGLSGLRPSNVYGLRFDEVRDGTCQLPPERMKNARWAVVPASGLVLDIIARRSMGSASPYVFPSPRDASKPYGSIKKAWTRLAKEAGCLWAVPYDCRHFFASQLAMDGATEQQVGRLLCHVGQSVTSRYVHQDIEALRPYVERLSERFQWALGKRAEGRERA